jgi:two-component system NtrC family sensor kinase
MRTPGLRLQLILLLGGLLVLTFVPLQLALSAYTQVTLRRLDDTQARALLQALTAYVKSAAPGRTPEELQDILTRDSEGSGLAAAAVELRGTPQLLPVGDLTLVAAMVTATGDLSLPQFTRVNGRRILAVAIPNAQGTVRLAVDADRSSSRGAALLSMFSLYAFLMACALLASAYFALTRLIVRPLDSLSQAAQNVTLGSQRLDVPASRVRELAELGTSLKRMTDRLLSEEASLKAKIAEVERATSDLTKAQRQLFRSERLASVGRLAAGLAHEIGNPIAALMGLQELLLDGDLSPAEQRDFVKRMQAETERIHRTLRDLLQFARPSRETNGSADSLGDVEGAIHDTAALVVHQSSMKELELSIDVYPGLPRVTLGTEQLVQVLLNLILNAADALTDQKGGKISVVARPRAESVEIEVRDNGPGVSPEVADQIFEPFFTTKEVGKGTGLGLSVCQGLVGAVGGSLSLDQSATQGARFIVQLPLAEPASQS